jgi:hypothetical protein
MARVRQQHIQVQAMKMSTRIVVAGVTILVIWATVSNREVVQDCRDRGGIWHCQGTSGIAIGRRTSYVAGQTCDCYQPDGRLLLPGQKAQALP